MFNFVSEIHFVYPYLFEFTFFFKKISAHLIDFVDQRNKWWEYFLKNDSKPIGKWSLF